MTQPNKALVKARQIWLTALATSTLIALTACTPTTDANPTHSTQPTTTTSTTIDEPTQNEASTTPLTAPAYPSGIDEFTEDNAIKFVEFYIELINYATQTGDTALLAEYSAADCTFCNDWIAYVSTEKDSGKSIKNFQISLTSTPILDTKLDAAFVFEIHFEQSKYWSEDGRSVVSGKYEADTTATSIALSWAQNEWVIYGIGEATE